MKTLSEFGWGWWLILLVPAVIIGIAIKALQGDTNFGFFVVMLVLAGCAFLEFLVIFFEIAVFSAPLQKQPYNTETIRPQKILSIKFANVTYISKDGHVVKSTNDIFPDCSNSATIGKVSVGQPQIVIKRYYHKPTSAFKVPDQWLSTQVIVDVTVSESQIRTFHLDEDD